MTAEPSIHLTRSRSYRAHPLRGQAPRRVLRHYLEMVVAMVAGMVVLGPAESVLLDPIGWAELRAHAESRALVMVTKMTVAMAAWMRIRGHGWAGTAEMAVAMYASFVVLFPPLWLGVLSATGLMVLGHVLMVLAMAAVVVVRRRDEYTWSEHPERLDGKGRQGGDDATADGP